MQTQMQNGFMPGRGQQFPGRGGFGPGRGGFGRGGFGATPMMPHAAMNGECNAHKVPVFW